MQATSWSHCSCRLDGRTAIVTGASKGIGRAIALAFAGAGARVVATARASRDLEDLLPKLRALQPDCATFSGDATLPETAQQIATKTHDQFGTIDILVNNVGGAVRYGGFLELTDADWLTAFNLNLMTTVRFTREALPYLRQSPHGRIVNVTSISAIQPGRFNPHYAAMKAAQLNLTKMIANTLSADGVLVNAIAPGPVESAAWDACIRDQGVRRGLSHDEAKLAVTEEEAGKVPLGRIGSPDDVACAALFLASDMGRWITGSCLQVDGGKLRTIH